MGCMYLYLKDGEMKEIEHERTITHPRTYLLYLEYNIEHLLLDTCETRLALASRHGKPEDLGKRGTR